ncbi:MAG: hypothetical protein B7Y34_04590, partial [Methylophilales bacterium 16-45-9]
SDTSSIIDDAAQVRFYEVQESAGGAEPPLDDQTFSHQYVFSMLLACASIVLFNYKFTENRSFNLRLLHQSRPRSPPQH